MMGLIKKDFLLMKKQQIFFMLAIFLGLSLVIGFEEPLGGIFASSMLTATLATTTIAYDDSNNGLAFLFTLPTTRKTYVWEKFLLTLLVSLLAVITVSIILFPFHTKEFLSWNFLELGMLLIISILVPTILASFLIPINLKFGAERGRLIMVILFMLIGMLGGILSEGTGVDFLTRYIGSIQPSILFVMYLFINAVIVGCSIMGSVRIINKKEF